MQPRLNFFTAAPETIKAALALEAHLVSSGPRLHEPNPESDREPVTDL